jgi:hypothetical protein
MDVANGFVLIAWIAGRHWRAYRSRSMKGSQSGKYRAGDAQRENVSKAASWFGRLSLYGKSRMM